HAGSLRNLPAEIRDDDALAGADAPEREFEPELGAASGGTSAERSGPRASGTHRCRLPFGVVPARVTRGTGHDGRVSHPTGRYSCQADCRWPETCPSDRAKRQTGISIPRPGRRRGTGGSVPCPAELERVCLQRLNAGEHRMQLSSHVRPAASRRDFLLRAGGGFGALALSYLLNHESIASGATVQVPPLVPRAKSVIWLFMEGGPSHVDLFDPKPMLQKLAGKPMPASFGHVITAMGTAGNTLMPTRRTFTRYGQSGIPVSDWYPQVAKHADELCVIRSCWADGLNHVGSVCQMNTGSIIAGRPSMGGWINYG